jgi:hypothetical protein
MPASVGASARLIAVNLKRRIVGPKLIQRPWRNLSIVTFGGANFHAYHGGV